jgi:diphthine-ammonia ligase
VKLVVKVALLSGGKDSLYAASKFWPVDFGLLLVYEFPVPSPHLINLGKSIETLLLTGTKVVVVKLDKGKEKEQTINILKKLNTTTIIAGDVYVEDHLKYMEGIANSVGAELKEPLWGEDPEELIYKIMSWGIKSLIIGIKGCMKMWLGKILSKDNVHEFINNAKRCNYDPLGERGEYHTLVVESPLHKSPLGYSIIERIKAKDFDGKEYYILKVN